MSEKPKKPREFEPVSSLEAKKMIAEGAKTFATAMLWSKDQTHVINSHLCYFSDNGENFYAWKPKDVDGRKLMDGLAKMAETELFFSVSLMRANVFFRARYIGFDSAGLKFAFPEKVFKVQRRKELRLPIRDGYVLRVDYRDPLHAENILNRKVFDMSAGGCSILVPYDEAIIYQQGLSIRDLSFTIRQRKIVTDAVVCHTSKVKGATKSENLNVGLEFKGIRPGDAQHIASYIFEESRKYYARLL